MSTLEYLANLQFGKRPVPRVGFKEHFDYFLKEGIKLMLLGCALAVLWVIYDGIRDVGAQEGRERALNEVSRIYEDPALLRQYLTENGH